MAKAFNYVWKNGDDIGIVEDFAVFAQALADRYEMLYGNDFSPAATKARAVLPAGPGTTKSGGVWGVRFPAEGDQSGTAAGNGINWPQLQTQLLYLSTLFADHRGTAKDKFIVFKLPDDAFVISAGGIATDFIRECETGDAVPTTTTQQNIQYAGWQTPQYRFARAFDKSYIPRFYKWPGPNGFQRCFERWIYKLSCPGVDGQIARFTVQTAFGFADSGVNVAWENEDHVWFAGVTDADPTNYNLTGLYTGTPTAERIHTGKLFRYSTVGHRWNEIPADEIEHDKLWPDLVKKYGMIREGDIMGEWIANDCRDALKLLKCTVVEGSGQQEPYGYFLGYQYIDQGLWIPLVGGTVIVDLGNGQTQLFFDGFRGATSFDVVRYTIAGGPFAVQSSIPATTTQITVPTIAGSSYGIIARNDAGDTGVVPFPHAGVAVGVSGDKNVGLAWDARRDVNLFEVTESYSVGLPYYDLPIVGYKPNGQPVKTFFASRVRHDADRSSGQALDVFGQNLTKHTVSPFENTVATAKAENTTNQPFYSAKVPSAFVQRYTSSDAWMKRNSACPAIFNLGLPGKSRTVTFMTMASFWDYRVQKRATVIFSDPIRRTVFTIIDQAVTTDFWWTGANLYCPIHAPQPYPISTNDIVKFYELQYLINEFGQIAGNAPSQAVLDEYTALVNKIIDVGDIEYRVELFVGVVDWTAAIG